MREVLVLGGSGLLGTALRLCAREGDRVLPSFASQSVAGGVVFTLKGDEPLSHADLVIGSFPMARQLEGRSADEIREQAKRYLDRIGGGPLVQLSTDAVFSGKDGLRGEGDQPDPTTAYGVTQARLDDALLDLAPGALIIRTSFIFGRAGDRFDKRLAPFVAREKPVQAQKWASNIYRSPTEVNFLAKAIWRAVEGGRTGILNLAGPRESIFDFFAKALEQLGQGDLPAPVLETSDTVARDTSLSVRLMETELGLKADEVWQCYRHYTQEAPAC